MTLITGMHGDREKPLALKEHSHVGVQRWVCSPICPLDGRVVNLKRGSVQREIAIFFVRQNKDNSNEKLIHMIYICTCTNKQTIDDFKG